MLYDTDVLIAYLRGNARAAAFLARPGYKAMSQVTWMELAQGARDKHDLAVTRAFLVRFSFTVLPLSENIGHRAVLYVEQHALKDGVEMADALIAATAVEHGLPLATANVKHFRPLAGVKVVPVSL
ncbi:MAG: type II toxin-antitoxin system VapC family toxin [Phycisphaerales bacterium]|nr:type II toxin-antitoxin system VapC family toxin [Phycisphaerales bacterium]